MNFPSAAMIRLICLNDRIDTPIIFPFFSDVKEYPGISSANLL